MFLFNVTLLLLLFGASACFLSLFHSKAEVEKHFTIMAHVW